MIGAATEKLRDPKPVQTRGMSNKLEPEERKVQDGTMFHVRHETSYAAKTTGMIAVVNNQTFSHQ